MKLFVLTLILLIVGSQAQMDVVAFNRIQEMLDEVRNQQENLSDSRTDLINFSKGFLEGVALSHVFDELKACIADDKTIMNDISQGISLIRTKVPENVKKGVKLLGDAAQLIPAAAKICKIADEKIQKLIDLIKTFRDPKAFAYYVGKSLLINHVEVLHEVQSAVNAYVDKNITAVGFWCGKAMATIFLKANEAFVEYLNQQATTWEATTYEQFEGLSDEEFKARYLGANLLDLNNLPEGVVIQGDEEITGDIPTDFDSAKEWPGCIHPIRNQMKCGSCWAFAAAEVLSDRFCIASNKGINEVLSPQYLVSCNNVLNHGCNGGVPLFSWWFLARDGLVTDACLPYQSGDGTVRPACKEFTSCADGSSIKKYYSKKSSTSLLTKPEIIQANILKFGPVEAAFQVYEDFKAYKGGIYKHVSGKLLGGHAVKINGWGNEGGVNYWIAANSWTENWGEKGFFRIAFGECGFDSQCIAGEADLTRATQSEFLSFW